MVTLLPGAVPHPCTAPSAVTHGYEREQSSDACVAVSNWPLYTKIKSVKQRFEGNVFTLLHLFFSILSSLISDAWLPLTQSFGRSLLLKASQPLTSTVHRRFIMSLSRVGTSQMFLKAQILCNCCFWLSKSLLMPLWTGSQASCRVFFLMTFSLGSVQTSRGPWALPAPQTCLPLQ